MATKSAQKQTELEVSSDNPLADVLARVLEAIRVLFGSSIAVILLGVVFFVILLIISIVGNF